MTTLTGITDDLLALDALLDEHGGDVSDPAVEAAVSAWMAELERSLADKADGYAAFIVELEARVRLRRDESQRLAARARVDERKCEYLRGRLLDAMRRTNTPVLNTSRYRLSIAKNGGVAPLVIVGDVPSEWMRTKVEVSPDRERIREALDAGTRLPFASYGERGERLVLR